MKITKIKNNLSVFAVLLLLVSSCAVGPNFQQVELETQDTFRFQTTPTDSLTMLDWNDLFKDTVLTALIDSALQKYDLLTVIFVIGLYVWFKHKLNQVHKDVKVVDQAVNNRPEGSMTMSQEVSEIHRKVDVQNNELKHVKDDVSFLKSDITKSRIYNMERFQSLESDINDVKNEICPKKNRR